MPQRRPSAAEPMERPTFEAREQPDDGLSGALLELIEKVGVGGRLPGERALAEQLGCSRTALRDRVQIYESLGVLSRRTGSGTYVQALDPGRLSQALNVGMVVSGLTLTSLQSVRVALERQAAREASVNQNHVMIAHMRDALDVLEAQPDDEQGEQADFDFHAALLYATDNPAIVFFADALHDVLRRSFSERRRDLVQIPGHQEMMVRIHRRIYDAVISRDPDWAMRAMDQHFDEFNTALKEAEIGLN